MPRSAVLSVWGINHRTLEPGRKKTLAKFPKRVVRPLGHPVRMESYVSLLKQHRTSLGYQKYLTLGLRIFFKSFFLCLNISLSLLYFAYYELSRKPIFSLSLFGMNLLCVCPGRHFITQGLVLTSKRSAFVKWLGKVFNEIPAIKDNNWYYGAYSKGHLQGFFWGGNSELFKNIERKLYFTFS